MYIKCKESFFIDNYSLLTKDCRYFVKEEEEEFFTIVDDTGRDLLISKFESKIHINFDIYFYTKYDLRKIKLAKLLK